MAAPWDCAYDESSISAFVHPEISHAMAKTLFSDSDDLLKFLDQEPLGSRASMDDDDDDDDDDSSSGSSSDDDDDDDDDSSSGSSSDDDDDYVLIDGLLVKLRGDGSIDDSQPTGLIRTTTGFKLRGDGSIDDSQPGGVRVIGTPRNDKIIGTGITRETLIGRKGSDDFILGNRQNPFYEDRARDRSYAIIKDLSGRDDILLSGSLSDYQIGSAARAGIKGTGIFYRSSDGNDLVALVAGQANINDGILGFL